MMAAPTLADVAEMLRQLLAGAVSRREVSAWARQWVAAEHPDVRDDVAWRALARLGAADLKGGGSEFLYYDIDFHAWLDEVENAIEARR
jgi:hypothetical protein